MEVNLTTVSLTFLSFLILLIQLNLLFLEAIIDESAAVNV